ncbi:MAG: NADH:ubiquinone reductase (Na(+)-transporting) subunit F, partial [Gammaproteobacteria bacterium]|nr:NADH:ubiquinone reductase (Na(+)-transporting) subunit F [Gammaproteobacteria bacterium]
MLETIIIGVTLFTLVILALVFIILAAKASLVSSGDVVININDDADKKVTTSAGGKLLGALANIGVFVPSACGGGGT